MKGREIYIPDTLNISIKESTDGLKVCVEVDKEGILEEAGVFYAEADVHTKCAYRDWQRICKVDGKDVKEGEFCTKIKPFEGATAVFAYAYAKYINGFRVMSKIVAKRLTDIDLYAVKGRMLFSGEEMDCFSVADYEDNSVGGIFLEREAVPKISIGYGGVKGAFSVGGIKTYKISAPTYIPDENALLKFDGYCRDSVTIQVTVDACDEDGKMERYSCFVPVKGGGKWKQIILKSADFKGESYGKPLASFADGRALTFQCDNKETDYAVTNILWL